MNKQKTAFITGITGQTGSYLAEILLNKGYRVIGLKRRTSLLNTQRIDHLYWNPNLHLEFFDLEDTSRIWELLTIYKPDEIYHLAAQSHVRVSYDCTESTTQGIFLGTLHLLNAIKTVCPETRLYFAATSEMFGDNKELPLNEESKFLPNSPYAIAKLGAFHLVRSYRNAYNLHASSGIIFNHCSERRGETFLTRKVTLAAARIKLGLQDTIELGNLSAMRDWGHAKDAAMAMYFMLQQPAGDDFIIATGEMHSAREFLDLVFGFAELDVPKHLKINERLYRPNEVDALLGDPSKAKRILGWEPVIKFEELAEKMYKSDLRLIRSQIKEGAKKWNIK